MFYPCFCLFSILQKKISSAYRQLYKIEPGLVVNGSMEQRVANNLNISFPGVDSGALVRSLNRFGICVSAGSACSSRRIKTSHVLKAIGTDTENYAAIRFGFGLNTTKEDLFYVLHCLDKILEKIKKESNP